MRTPTLVTSRRLILRICFKALRVNHLAKTLIVFGVALVVTGIMIQLAGRIPGLGKLPGDISVRRENFSFDFPLTTCLLVSLFLTLVFNLFGRR